MRESDQSGALPPSLALRIENLCTRFEAAWKAGREPRIEDFLEDVPEPERSRLLRELLAVELEYRHHQGETLVLDDYRQRFPDQAEVVVAVFRAAGGWVGPSAGESASSHQQVSTGPDVRCPGEPEQPERLGRYRITGTLGKGGFGVVYQGYDDDLHRAVAIKVPHRHRVSQPEDVEAYLAEARILASLDHPHIVPVHDVGRTEDGLCSFEAAWNHYAKKCGSDKKYDRKKVNSAVGETKNGRYVILDHVADVLGQTSGLFAYDTEKYTVSVRISESADKKAVYASITVALR
jgi:hypothetical protein